MRAAPSEWPSSRSTCPSRSKAKWSCCRRDGRRTPMPMLRRRQPMNAAALVQRQLDAYNAHDLERFVAEYAADVEVFRPPAGNPVLSGLQSFTAHYASNRFTLPDL